MYRSVGKVLVGISACALALPGLAAESTKPAVDIKDVFRAFLKQGKTSTGSSISILSPDILFVGDASGSIPYVEQIGTPGGVNVQTSLPRRKGRSKTCRSFSERCVRRAVLPEARWFNVRCLMACLQAAHRKLLAGSRP
jgi:hypothetical protein